MANKEWDRKESWSAEDEADFFAHLKRSKSPYYKAQHLRVQAVTLLSTGDLNLAPTAILLAQKSIDDYPGETSQIAICYLIIGRSNEQLGNIEEAISAFENCVETQRKYPNYLTNVHIDFAVFAVRHKLTELYDEVVEILNEFESVSKFPIDLFQHWGCRSIIAEETDNASDAKLFANFALNAAKQVHSGFLKHPTMGLVTDQSCDFYKRIEEIANIPVSIHLDMEAAKKIALDIQEKEKNPDDETKCRKALKEVGLSINSIYDLVNSRGDYPEAIPALIRLVRQVETPKIKEQVIRALTVKSAKRRCEETIINEYLQVPKTDEYHCVKWVIGNTLYYLGTIDQYFDAIAEIVSDKSHGTTRKMLVSLLGKSKKHKEQAEKILLELLEDKDVQGHAINALGNLRSVRAIEPIEEFLSSTNEWHRREARTALKKIQKSLTL